MAFTEKVPSPKGDYWRGRFLAPDGRYLTVRDEQGRVIRFAKKADAKKAADASEVAVSKGTWRDPSAGAVTFAEWVQDWYAGLDLADSTMANRRRHLENHLLPFFGTAAMRDIDAAMIGRWERSEKAAGYMAASIRTWRGTLHVVLEDAVGHHLAVNPATRKRGRGRRSGSGRKASGRGPEKVITSPLGVLLIAERMAVLTGRDDEFVMTVTAFWEALRLGELVGLEKGYVRAASLRIEWQLSEVEGRLLRVPPKDDSRGDPDTPPFLRSLLAAHIARTRPEACPCHGKAYVFRGLGTPAVRGNMPIREVAAAAGVSETVVQVALGAKGRISDQARAHVLAVADRIGYRRPSGSPGPAAHWRRSSFEGLFTAAASGWLPPKAPMPRRPVLLRGEWPGTRVEGRNAEGRAEMCWTPVAEGLTPHGLRHSVKTWMEERGIAEIMSETHLRHDIPGISGAYRHVSPAMRRDLTAAMTGAWEEALDHRLEMSPGSSVAVADGLLRARAAARKPALVSRDSPRTPEGVLPFPVSTPSDLRRGDRI